MRTPIRLLSIYFRKKSRAKKLRKKGQSYTEIADTLMISKSTAYSWAKGIKLPKIARMRIEKKMKESFGKGLAAYNKIYGKIRSEEAAKIRGVIEEKSSKEITSLSFNDLRLIGSALYWAEGGTKNRNRLQFSNSNPLMIKVAMQFFRRVCSAPDNKIKALIHIYPGINYQKTLNFWRQITKLSKNNFYPPQVQISKASKKKRPKNTLLHGTLHLIIIDTRIACMVKGWIRGIAENLT